MEDEQAAGDDGSQASIDAAVKPNTNQIRGLKLQVLHY
jgi:hypothetical protein